MEKYQIFGKQSRRGFQELKPAKAFALRLARRIKAEVEISIVQEERYGSSCTAHTKVDGLGKFYSFVRGSWVQEGFKMLNDGRIVPIGANRVKEEW